MKRKSVFITFDLVHFGIFIVFALLLLSCSKDDDNTSEPECALVCTIGTESYSFEITCESGSYSTAVNNESTEYQYDSYGNVSVIKLNLNRTRTYENTNNTYTIVGFIIVNLTQNTESHDITVSGGAFENPQTCN